MPGGSGVPLAYHVLVRAVLGLIVLGGGALSWLSVTDSPAARIALQARLDHQRALRMAASPGPAAPVPRPRLPRRGREMGSAPSWSPAPGREVATITIPALGIAAAPVLDERAVSGSLTIPPVVKDIGWDDETPPPGWAGITVLAGHVNWVGQGEGSLGQIGQLVRGDQVILDWRGRRHTYVVSTAPRLSSNTVAHADLFRSTGRPVLALVTCGGPFTETSHGGSYADNVIVEAVPVAATRGAAAHSS